MMNETLRLLLSLASGISLGLLYFGGLWLTLKRLPGNGQPALLTLVSFLARSALCLFGFYLIAGQGLELLAFSLVGFISLKFALIHHLSPPHVGAD